MALLASMDVVTQGRLIERITELEADARSMEITLRNRDAEVERLREDAKYWHNEVRILEGRGPEQLGAERVKKGGG